MALGNGAPDMFSAYAAITQADDGEAGLAIGALFGRLRWSCRGCSVMELAHYYNTQPSLPPLADMPLPPPLTPPHSASPHAGAGMFVTTIVTGAVSIYKPFTLTKRPFMRDIIFYIFAVYLTFYVLWTNTVELYQAIGT